MTGLRRRGSRLSEYRRLIHVLNQRYHREFIRAESYAGDAAFARRLRGSWLFCILRWIKNLRHKPLKDGAVAPFEIKPAEIRGRVSIIIPFKDRVELLRDCLASLRPSTYRRFEIILVDNGSSDSALHRLVARLEKRKRFCVIRDPSPFNFSRLCNKGAAASRGDWLLFLNNDTCVLTPDWLEHMILAASQPTAGIVGAALYYPDGTLQHAGMVQRGDGVWEHLTQGQATIGGDVLSVPAVSAACMLIGRELFEAVGGFDESRPVTHNDVDLCRQVRVLGRQIVMTPHARLLHYELLSRGYALTPPDRL